MKQLSALQSTVLLTAVSLFSQGVGFIYRVFLSRMIGAEVMGLYQLVMPAFSVLMSLTATGFTAACSNLSARYRAVGDVPGASQTLRVCVTGALAAFGIAALAVVPLSDVISVRLLGDARTRLGLLLLLPCVLLTGLENLHKHAFYGMGDVRPPAFTETLEQLIRAGAVLALLRYFLPQSPEKTVGLIVCGMILCELFSSLTLTSLYRRALGAAAGGRGSRRGLGKKVLRIALPIGMTALLGNLMGAATAVLIPQRLVRAGSKVSSAMGDFGILCGMTLPLLSLPTAFISAMGLVLLPRLAEAAALGREELVRRRASRAITATAWLILPASALLAVLAPPLGRVLFREAAVGRFSPLLALGVVLTCFESVLMVCLNALGKQTAAAGNNLICGAVQLFLTWWWMGLPGMGLRGYVEALLLSTLLGVLLNWRVLRRSAGLSPRWFEWIVAPGLASLLSALCVRLLFLVLTRAGLGEVPAALGCLVFGGVLYLSAMTAQGVWPHPGRPGSGFLTKGR